MVMKGMSYGWNAIREQYKTEDSYKSLCELKRMNCDWIAISFNAWQDEYYSTQIYFDYQDTMTDDDIKCVVNRAHDLELKVCLKPVVNIKSGVWRGYISFPDDASGDKYWNKWFHSYLCFLLHYAKMAEELKCEMLCIGCEYIFADRRTKDWVNIIEAVRNVYSGKVIYNANHGYEQNIQWFDKTDFIGTSAYISVGTDEDVGLEGMKSQWKAYKNDMVQLYEKFQKKIVFMEAGCMSGRKCSLEPWTYQSELFEFDETEQNHYYLSLLQEFWEEPWFGGVFWWSWETDFSVLEQFKNKVNYSIYGKESGNVVRNWYKNH